MCIRDRYMGMATTNNFLKDIQNAMNMDVFDEANEVADNLQMQDQQFNQLFDQYQVGDIDDEYSKYEAEILQNQLQQDQINQVQFQPIQNQEQYSFQPQQYVQQNENQQELMLN
eukprot:TRINITY_DN4357_c0_g1_i1.p2 TRINITY_DN4357_c0_g1~~TRINITY_DN4357_c0_g1_i1.p2  ORF type:complete len:114 (+),score=20.44 TRINITY_DN4357_c0_g1_i1:94-435(+)